MANNFQRPGSIQKVPLRLGRAAYNRQAAQQPEIQLVNRYFEENPTNLEGVVSLLSRPPTTKEADIGSGRVRGTYAQEGAFNGDLFVASGTQLFRYTKQGVVVSITGTLSNDGDVQMAATDTPYLFLTDGTGLYYYAGDETYAYGTLYLGGPPLNGETATIGATTYTFVTSFSSAPAYEVLIGLSDDDTLENLVAAINNATGEGALYGDDTPKNTQVTARIASATSMEVTAIAPGASQNSVATADTLTGSASGWLATTLSGGADASLNTITLPASETFVSVCVLAQYVICVVSNSQKWFFIRPGEVTIDALDFYSAEQIPDEIISCRTVGDNVAFFGSRSTEFWYANVNGDADDPFSRIQGAAFSRGVLEGSDVLLNDQLILVADDNTVRLALSNQTISNYAVSEAIRRAKAAQ